MVGSNVNVRLCSWRPYGFCPALRSLLKRRGASGPTRPATPPTLRSIEYEHVNNTLPFGWFCRRKGRTCFTGTGTRWYKAPIISNLVCEVSTSHHGQASGTGAGHVWHPSAMRALRCCADGFAPVTSADHSRNPKRPAKDRTVPSTGQLSLLELQTYRAAIFRARKRALGPPAWALFRPPCLGSKVGAVGPFGGGHCRGRPVPARGTE